MFDNIFTPLQRVIEKIKADARQCAVASQGRSLLVVLGPVWLFSFLCFIFCCTLVLWSFFYLNIIHAVLLHGLEKKCMHSDFTNHAFQFSVRHIKFER